MSYGCLQTYTGWTYDGYGNQTTADAEGDVATGDDDTCTTTAYVTNALANLRRYDGTSATTLAAAPSIVDTDWSGYNLTVGAGDFTGDGKKDLITSSDPAGTKACPVDDCGGTKSPAIDHTSEWDKPTLKATATKDWLKAYEKLFPARCSTGADAYGLCGHGPAAWMIRAVVYGTEAGVDPRIVLSDLMAEVANSENWDGLDRSLQIGQVVADKVGIYGPLKRFIGDRTGFKEGGEANPPSIGWGNIQEEVFDQTRANHLDALGDVSWIDLIADHDLAMKVTAYRLADTMSYAKSHATPLLRQQYSPQQVAGAIYNVGESGLLDALSEYGTLGKDGGTYGRTMGSYMETSDGLICGSGVFVCS